MISPILSRVTTILPAPTGAYPLPGYDSIVNRIAPGGVVAPTEAEKVTAISLAEYRTLAYVPAVQPYTYATNPRKDGTTPMLSVADDTTNLPQSYVPAAPIARNNTGNTEFVDVSEFNKSAYSVNAAAFNQAVNATSPTKPVFDAMALIILGAIAFFVLRR